MKYRESWVQAHQIAQSLTPCITCCDVLLTLTSTLVLVGDHFEGDCRFLRALE